MHVAHSCRHAASVVGDSLFVAPVVALRDLLATHSQVQRKVSLDLAGSLLDLQSHATKIERLLALLSRGWGRNNLRALWFGPGLLGKYSWRFSRIHPHTNVKRPLTFRVCGLLVCKAASASSTEHVDPGQAIASPRHVDSDQEADSDQKAPSPQVDEVDTGETDDNMLKIALDPPRRGRVE